MSRAGLDKNPREVAEMFDGVAEGYDRTNSVMTLGFDRRWREWSRRVLDARPGEKVLDLAAGTAVSTVEYGESGAWCVAADFSLGMLRGGAKRPVPKVAADALHLPFRDGAFDAVTVSFGLRNFEDTEAALREMARVVRPGGRLVVCEVSSPTFGPFRAVYKRHLLKVLPVVAKRVSSNPVAYNYLAESMATWPDQRALGEIVARAGWDDVAWFNLTGGLVALHRAVKPLD
ncbi:demethylmenaquinone methyltransferase [Actinosynnema pretiosum subsp. pretiosum]|uniref:Demethylmenaquinone methyltransferase n=2 Tax=Actinosynnema TaxID=40566 RepID=C6WNB7_ACTMD|nr:demethylmenaquinone methyltransferase [Actinosynnema mirum]ACU40481.1 ubiquinone/menaquinone biosynthesis methyltransferase [Actinosynnema mirum DSM 43827]AXX33995.1 2-heptaprenyl-1,4-naphthoquinone methyltransferase [Actinosynnema pretiosum subsp. pretiosum]QUF02263.1 demethylmenaquinone methyltransferase [Actinosynnema pretiosum subsp. pretiosum]